MTLATTLGDVLRSHGFAGRGRRWMRQVSDVVTIVEIDSPPKSRSVALDVGVWTAAFGGEKPTGVTPCPLLMHIETMPLIDRTEPLDVARSFELTSDMCEEERLAIVTRRAEALARYLAELSSVETLAAAYRRGELAAAVMRADVRAVLADETQVDE